MGGPAAGGDEVTIRGHHLVGATSVGFGESCLVTGGVATGLCSPNLAPRFTCRSGKDYDVCTATVPPAPTLTPTFPGSGLAIVMVRVVTPAGVSETHGIYKTGYWYGLPNPRVPDMTIESPAEGQRYAVDARVSATYRCGRDESASKALRCELSQDGAVLPPDALIDTRTPGTKRLVLTGTYFSGVASVTRTYIVDGVKPDIDIVSPVGVHDYERGAEVAALYRCRDRSGPDDVERCTGEVGGRPVPSGSPLPAGKIGEHTLWVHARDRAGNETTRGMRYRVVAPKRGGAPRVTVSSPDDGRGVPVGSRLQARYECRPGPQGTLVVSCFGREGGSPVSDGAPIDTATPGDRVLSVTAVDDAGRVTTRQVRFTVGVAAPRAEIVQPFDGQVLEQDQSVRAGYTCTDDDGPDDIVSCTGTVPASAPLDTATVGEHAFTVTAVDRAGHRARQSVTYRVVPRDTTPPTIDIASPIEGMAYLTGGYARATYSCRDDRGAVVFCRGTVPAGGQIDTAGEGVHTLTVAAQDEAGNEATRTVTYVTVAGFGPVASAPVVDLLTPFDGDAYPMGSTVTSSFSCADADGDLVSCTGPVASGQPVDTSSLGSHGFTVVGTDRGGRTASARTTYTVVDAGAPAIFVQSPVRAHRYPRGSTHVVEYGCDAATTCVGSQPSGSTLDTSTPGRKTFTVTATNAAGTSRRTIVYFVD